MSHIGPHGESSLISDISNLLLSWKWLFRRFRWKQSWHFQCAGRGRKVTFLCRNQVIGDTSRQKRHASSLFCSLGTISQSVCGCLVYGIEENGMDIFTREILNSNEVYPMQSLRLITSSKTIASFKNLPVEFPPSTHFMTLLRTHSASKGTGGLSKNCELPQKAS